MVWQDMSPFPTPRMDAEEEREMRLAAQARAGAEWALAALIARYQPPVLRYLARLTGNPYQSRRIAERIFVRMERRLRGPHGAEHLRLWLLRAATEAGLDTLRHPKRSNQPTQLNAPAGPRALLMDGLSGNAGERLRAGLGKIAAITGSTRRQVRQLIWNAAEPAETGAMPEAAPSQPATELPPGIDPEIDSMNPQEELRHRLIRAVLAELPYGDAQCLALHLVAGLNQTEVARALGIRPSAARHRIVQGLQMFAHRYDAAITSLGVPLEVAYAESAESLPTPAASVLGAHTFADESYPAPAETPPGLDSASYAASTANGSLAELEPTTEGEELTATYGGEYGGEYDGEYGGEYGGGYGGEYELADAVSAQVVAEPAMESPASEPTPEPVIVDALPATPSDEATISTDQDYPAGPADNVPLDEVPDESWTDQPTMVPILSRGADAEASEASDAPPPAAAHDAMNGSGSAMPGHPDGAGSAVTPLVPILTPTNEQ